MPLEGDYEPSPWDMIADHVERYEASGGGPGTELEGAPCIILTTKGAKSAKVRKTPLMRVTDGENYAVVASMGGAPNHPVWYFNLVADRHVMLQDGPVRRDYVVHQAEGAEKSEWWARAVAVWPSYDEYQAATDRVIPLFVLVPQD